MDFRMFRDKLREGIWTAAKEKIGGDFAFEESFQEGKGTYDIIFCQKSGLASAAVNTVDYYAAFQAGRPMEEIVEEAVAALKKHLAEEEEKQMLGRMAVAQNIVPVLLPGTGNEELLEEVPHIAFGSMEIIFKFVLLEPVNGRYMSCTVPKSYMEEQGWDKEQLLEVAMGNQAYTGQLHVMPFRKMVDALILGDGGKDLDSDWEGLKEDPMKVALITNSLRSYGAAGMLHKETLERISSIYGEDLYILPSSVHECLVFRKGAMPLEHLQEMIQEINQEEVSQKEWLSDDVYAFDRRTREITLAGKSQEGSER